MLKPIINVIQFEGDSSTLVWKHPAENFNTNSQLIVHESQEAIFYRDGQALDTFGPGRHTLKTERLPLLNALIKIPTGGEELFHSEVYFINLATVFGVKWGTDSKIGLFDPASKMHIEIGASGEFNIKVINSRKLMIKAVGTTGGVVQPDDRNNTGITGFFKKNKSASNENNVLFNFGDGKSLFRGLVVNRVKSNLARVIKEKAINILEVDEHLDVLSEILCNVINEDLYEYGLEMPSFFVKRVVMPDEDPNFRRLKEQYASQYLRVREEEIRRAEAEAAAERKAVEAATEARLKIIGAQGSAEVMKIQAFAEAEAHKAKAEAEAQEMRLKRYSYQQETSRLVGMEAMKNGISGGENGSGIGDIASLGIALGAMNGVAGMTREAISPMADTISLGMAGFVGKINEDFWDCECGNTSIVGNFCTNCGAKKPIRNNGSWDCICGARGIIGNFCSNCGAKRPNVSGITWDCVCGQKGIKGNFCSNCGEKRSID